MTRTSPVGTDSSESGTDDLIWHYTTAPGLRGILEREVIFATDALYLNDARELREALDLQREALHEAGASVVPGSQFGVLHGALVVPHLDNLEPPEGIFIASFCRKRDLLSQWRGYAGAQGYAIGISRSGLSQSARNDSVELSPVTYGEPGADLKSRLVATTWVRTGGERAASCLGGPGCDSSTQEPRLR